MALCPSCNQPIENADFGLVTCENCGASVMVDFDGSATSSSEENLQDEASLSSPEQDDSLQSYESNEDDFISSSFVSDNVEYEDNEIDQRQPTSILETGPEVNLENKEIAEWGEDENSKVVTIGGGTVDYERFVDQQEVSESLEDNARAFEESMESHPYDGNYESVNEASSTDEISVSDIEKYGNSSSSQEGPLLYSVTISGIDSQELRDQVREALVDRRLLFDVEGILKGIKGGQIQLKDVSSLKTYVLVNQLLNLPLKFEWGQEANGNP